MDDAGTASQLVPPVVADAWAEGASLPDQLHRLQLVARPPREEELYSDERFQGTQELYDEGREWWETS